MTFGQRIKSLRLEKGATQKELADFIGVSDRVVGYYEADNRFPKEEGLLLKLAEYFNVSADYLLGADTKQNIAETKEPTKKKKTIKIPVLGSVKAGIHEEAIQDIIGYEEISEELATQGEFFALRIKGESMEPRMLDGDTVIIRMQSDVESGDIAVVLINGDSSTIKKVIKQNNGILLTAFNPAVYTPTFYSNKEIETLPVKILGRVVEFRGKL